MNSNIISILQLLGEGWKPKIFIKDSRKIIQMTHDGKHLIFYEHGQRKNLCFLTASIKETKLVAAVQFDTYPPTVIGETTDGAKTLKP